MQFFTFPNQNFKEPRKSISGQIRTLPFILLGHKLKLGFSLLILFAGNYLELSRSYRLAIGVRDCAIQQHGRMEFRQSLFLSLWL